MHSSAQLDLFLHAVLDLECFFLHLIILPHILKLPGDASELNLCNAHLPFALFCFLLFRKLARGTSASPIRSLPARPSLT